MGFFGPNAKERARIAELELQLYKEKQISRGLEERWNAYKASGVANEELASSLFDQITACYDRRHAVDEEIAELKGEKNEPERDHAAMIGARVSAVAQNRGRSRLFQKLAVTVVTIADAVDKEQGANF